MFYHKISRLCLSCRIQKKLSSSALSSLHCAEDWSSTEPPGGEIAKDVNRKFWSALLFYYYSIIIILFYYSVKAHCHSWQPESHTDVCMFCRCSAFRHILERALLSGLVYFTFQRSPRACMFSGCQYINVFCTWWAPLWSLSAHWGKTWPGSTSCTAAELLIERKSRKDIKSEMKWINKSHCLIEGTRQHCFLTTSSVAILKQKQHFFSSSPHVSSLSFVTWNTNKQTTLAWLGLLSDIVTSSCTHESLVAVIDLWLIPKN